MADLAVQGGDAGRVDDHAPLLVLGLLGRDLGCSQPQDVEGPDQVHAHHELETLEIDRPTVAGKDSAGKANACAIHDDVETAKALHRGVDRGPNVVLRSDVRGSETRPVSQLFRYHLAVGRGQIHDDRRRPRVQQLLRGGEPEARRSSRNQRDLSFEPHSASMSLAFPAKGSP